MHDYNFWKLQSFRNLHQNLHSESTCKMLNMAVLRVGRATGKGFENKIHFIQITHIEFI